MNYKKKINRLIKGKVIIAFAVSCIALILAVTTSRITFRKVLQTVRSISAPNEKLRLVNKISHDLTRLDQLQRAQVINNQGFDRDFIKESRLLRQTLDTLGTWYKETSLQRRRVDSMKNILVERNMLFTNYLKVRAGLINGSVFSDQVDSISGLIAARSAQMDTTLTKVEHKTSTTTIISPPPAYVSPKNIFNRIFGKRRVAQPDSQAKKIVEEEIDLRSDTLTLAQQDSFVHKVEKLMYEMKKDQDDRRMRFVNREIALANTGNELTGQMLTLLQEVQKEVVNQMNASNIQANNVVNKSVERIGWIAIFFFTLMAILIYFILADISGSNEYRKQLEIAKEEAEYHGAAKQRFLSNMSHEIRTPLQSIIGYSELIYQQEKPERAHVDAIYQSSNHLLQIADEVLDYSRIISGKFTFEKRPFNISDLLKDLVATMQPQADKKSLDLLLKTEIPEGLSIVNADAFRLKQILYNLLGNAIKFTESGRVELLVQAKPNGRTADFNFRISDTGPGISTADLGRIFQPFERAVSSQTNGTGLGLAIVKSLIETQGGSIQAKSNIGKGSVFIVNMNFECVNEVVSSRSQINKVEFGHKIWIVDDDRFILQLCASILEKHDIGFKTFNNAAELLSEPWDKEVKLILTDMRMPGMEGKELIKVLRKKLPPDVKIVALTAQALPGEREVIMSQGFDAILLKPFREAGLAEILNGSITPELPGNDEPFILDSRALERITMGNAEELPGIIELFIHDCRDDIKALKTAVQNESIKDVSLLVHRLAGRIAQAGQSELAQRFRSLELALGNCEVMDASCKQKIRAGISHLDELLLALAPFNPVHT